MNVNVSENQVEGLTFSDLALEVTKPHCPYTPLVGLDSRTTQIQGEGPRPTSLWKQSPSCCQQVRWNGVSTQSRHLWEIPSTMLYRRGGRGRCLL